MEEFKHYHKVYNVTSKKFQGTLIWVDTQEISNNFCKIRRPI